MIKRYDLFQVHPCGENQRGELRETADGDYVAFEDVQHFFGPQSETRDELFLRVASAIDDADFGFSLKLTRLLDGVSEYTVTFSDGTPPMVFPDTENAYEYIRGRKLLAKAQAAIAALAPASGSQMVVTDELAITYKAAFRAVFDRWLNDEGGIPQENIGLIATKAGLQAVFDALTTEGQP